MKAKEHYAVIFSSKKRIITGADDAAYSEMSKIMFDLAAKMPGYLGVETAHGEGGRGITISYWESDTAIKKWRDHSDHVIARQRGKDEWYDAYEIRVARVERYYNWNIEEEEFNG